MEVKEEIVIEKNTNFNKLPEGYDDPFPGNHLKDPSTFKRSEKILVLDAVKLVEDTLMDELKKIDAVVHISDISVEAIENVENLSKNLNDKISLNQNKPDQYKEVIVKEIIVEKTDEVTKTKLSEVTNENDTLKQQLHTLSEKISMLETDNTKHKIDKKIIEIKSFCESLVEEGIYPSVIEEVKSFMLADVKSPVNFKLSEGEETKEYDLKGMFKRIFNSFPKDSKIDFSERVTAKCEEKNDAKTDDKLTDEYITKRMSELKII